LSAKVQSDKNLDDLKFFKIRSAMGIRFHPQRGQILLCDFSGLKAPEMIKRRPVVAVSPRYRRQTGLCTVVPLSTTAPNPVQRHHHLITLTTELPHPFTGQQKWLKGDMIYTMSFARLDRPHAGKDPQTGKRQYLDIILPASEMAAIELCIKAALGLRD